MSTRLHALGFPASWTLQAAQQLEALAEGKARTVQAPKGHYRLWRTQAGAELWFHCPRRDPARRGAPTPAPSGHRLTAVTPFHRGLSSCSVRIGRVLTFDRSNPLEGSCLAWLPPAAVGGREQVIVLELAPFALQPLKPTPFNTIAQIACFAHAVWAFPDVATYSTSTPRNRRIMAGAFSPITETDVPEVRLSYRHSPVTLGLATGLVKRSIRHTNPVTGDPYYWMLLETRRGTFDVLANPASVTGDISEGQVAQVCGSFLARLSGTPV